ncbi:MAG: iron ABC transporter permease [Anaerolineae bacterium]|nr:iron ABC transporter permease [Anaerolineae bacterium]
MRRDYLWPTLLLSLLLLLAIFFSLGLGAVSITPGQVWAALNPQISPEAVSPAVHTIVWDFRLARVLLAALVGAALAGAGAAFQGLFRNPLADPFVIGASGGAALGATLAMAFGWTIAWLGFAPVSLAAFAGAMLAVILAYTISEVSGQTNILALLLAGTALSSAFSAGVSLLLVLNDHDFVNIFFWLMGGFSGRSWDDLWLALPYIAVGLLGLGLLARPLDVLAFGEETAQGLGVSVRPVRLLIVLCATLATAAAVANSGIIGFVGLIAPHIARLLWGPVHALLIPTSILLGALLLVIADTAARTIMAPVELPVGILTSLLGAPFFLYLLRTRREMF